MSARRRRECLPLFSGSELSAALAASEVEAIAKQREELGITDEIDRLVRQHTAFGSMPELLGAPYRPSLNVAIPEVRRIADAYDWAQAFLGKYRRAHRFTYEREEAACP